uniref:Uncharacterized protein n=1 Tax=Arundo donax TaxID=35708 RepID=A0A0A9AX96_ARUDO
MKILDEQISRDLRPSGTHFSKLIYHFIITTEYM